MSSDNEKRDLLIQAPNTGIFILTQYQLRWFESEASICLHFKHIFESLVASGNFLGDMALQEEICHLGMGFQVSKDQAIPS